MVLPEYITFFDWASTLQVDYPNGNVPIVNEDTDWQEWADRLLQSDPFDSAVVPEPNSFDDWRDWARWFVDVMNN